MKTAILCAATVVLLAICLAASLLWLNPAEVTPVLDCPDYDIFNPIFLGP